MVSRYPRYFPLVLTSSAFAEGVGKSTIVTSLIKESFVAHVCSSILHVLVILIYSPSGSTCRSGGHYTTGGHSRERDHLYCRFRRSVSEFDDSVRALINFIQVTPQDRQHLESEVRKAHVICVVYSIDNPHSFDRIPTYWLPLFRQLGVNVGLLSLCPS